MFSKVFLASTLASIVTAVNEAPVVPVSAQIGALDFGITCDVPILGRYTFSGYFRATAAAQANSGQQIYYDDLIAEVTIPPSITSLAALVGASSASANVRVALNLENASPAKYDVFPNGLQIDNVKITPGSALTVRVPQNGTLLPLGPVTMGDAGKTHAIHLGDVSIIVSIPVFGFNIPLPINCPAPTIPYDIGIVNILPAGTADFPAKPTTNGKFKFATIGNGEETGSFRFPYDCNFQDVIQQPVDLTITGTVPTYLNPGKQFNVKDVYAYLRIPSELTAKVKEIATEAAGARFTADAFQIGVINGSPAQYNALPSPQSGNVQLVDGQDIALAIPQDEVLTIGPITAGTSGDELFLDAQEANGSVDLLDGTGNNIISVSFECKPRYTSKLIGIPVTDETPSAISP